MADSGPGPAETGPEPPETRPEPPETGPGPRGAGTGAAGGRAGAGVVMCQPRQAAGAKRGRAAKAARRAVGERAVKALKCLLEGCGPHRRCRKVPGDVGEHRGDPRYG